VAAWFLEGWEKLAVLMQPCSQMLRKIGLVGFVIYIFVWIKRLTRAVLRRSPEIAKHIRALFQQRLAGDAYPPLNAQPSTAPKPFLFFARHNNHLCLSDTEHLMPAILPTRNKLSIIKLIL
jgi:hypothetical protein